MCKTNKKMVFYSANICKHEHEKNMTRLWCKIMPKTNVEQFLKNDVLLLFIPLWGLNLKKFPKRFLCVH
jgi:hypothetical protein